MVEQQGRMLSPFLALVQLYKKEGKSFQDVVDTIMDRLNLLDFGLDKDYIKDKVMPWILSFLFMSISEQLLQEYIKSLSNVDAAAPGITKLPKEPNKGY